MSHAITLMRGIANSIEREASADVEGYGRAAIDRAQAINRCADVIAAEVTAAKRKTKAAN